MSDANLGQMYQEIIMEHSKEPRNFRGLPKADVECEGYNPLCGDRVILQLNRQGDQVSEIGFQGEGCSICMASASIMTEEVEGQSINATTNKVEEFRELMKGERDEEEAEGDVEALMGVKKFPVRIKCALLPWTTLKECLEKIMTFEEIKKLIYPVIDPELFISIVDLGLIYGGELDENGFCKVQMTLTSPGCPMGDHLIQETETALKKSDQIKEAKVEIVWEPKWDPKEMATEEGKESLGLW